MPSHVNFGTHVKDLAYAYGRPVATGKIRQHFSDFRVWEHLSFDPTGSGEHVMLQIEKTNINTDDVALLLAKFAGLKKVDVGYAGLKDKRAQTTQWFSLNLSGKPMPDWSHFVHDGLQIIHVTRHDRKLKTGAVARNRFQIIVDQLETPPSWLDQRLDQVKSNGVPNYFAEQRFGHNEQNLYRAREMLQGKRVKSRHLRGVYYSALRSFLFNQVLSKRVETQLWNKGISGDAMALNGSRAYFIAESMDAEIEKRLQSFDIHPSGPLPGINCANSVRGEAAVLEQAVLSQYSDLCQGLERSGLKTQRRALRLVIPDLVYSFLGEQRIQLEFTLPSGAYATTVLREMVLLG